MTALGARRSAEGLKPRPLRVPLEGGLCAGYMVARMLGAAPSVADAIIEQLCAPTDADSKSRERRPGYRRTAQVRAGGTLPRLLLGAPPIAAPGGVLARTVRRRCLG